MLRRTAPLLSVMWALVAVGCGGGGSSAPADARVTATGAEAGPFRSVSVKARVSPSQPGTPEHPQGVRLNLDVSIGAAKDVEPPQVDGIDLTFPPGSSYGGDALPACSKSMLERRGPDGCPPEAITGKGTLVAYADTARSPGRITVVNGGEDELYFWTEIDRPARVQAAVVGTIERQEGGGYRLHLAIPQKLQVVAGVPIALRRLIVHAGSGAWLATTGCPDGTWTFTGAAVFGDGSKISRDTEQRCDA